MRETGSICQDELSALRRARKSSCIDEIKGMKRTQNLPHLRSEFIATHTHRLHYEAALPFGLDTSHLSGEQPKRFGIRWQ